MYDQLDPNTQTFVPAEQMAAPAQPQEQKQPAQSQESSKEQNLRMLREQNDRNERRAQEAERRAQEYERIIQQNMNQSQPSQKMQFSDEDDMDISDDSYVEAKVLKKHLRAVRNELKQTRQQSQEMLQKLAIDNAEARLKSKFNDFDSIVNEDNLNKLKYADPVMYRAVLANTDIYDRGYVAYNSIKNSNVFGEIEPVQYNETQRRVDENRARPRSAANAAPQAPETPLARFGEYDRRVLTEADKDRIRRNVEQAKRFKE